METSSRFSFGNTPDLSVRSSQGVHTTGVVGSNSASDIFVDWPKGNNITLSLWLYCRIEIWYRIRQSRWGIKAVMHQGSSRGRHFAGIAQLAVRITCNDEVIGSTPIASSAEKQKNTQNLRQKYPLWILWDSTIVRAGRNWFSVRIYETNTVTGEAAGFCEGYLRKCKYVTHLTLLDVGAESGGM